MRVGNDLAGTARRFTTAINHRNPAANMERLVGSGVTLGVHPCVRRADTTNGAFGPNRASRVLALRLRRMIRHHFGSLAKEAGPSPPRRPACLAARPPPAEPVKPFYDRVL